MAEKIRWLIIMFLGVIFFLDVCSSKGMNGQLYHEIDPNVELCALP